MSCFIIIFSTIPYHISIIDFAHIQIIIRTARDGSKFYTGGRRGVLPMKNFGRTGEKFLKGGAKKSIFQWPRYTTEATMRRERRQIDN